VYIFTSNWGSRGKSHLACSRETMQSEIEFFAIVSSINRTKMSYFKKFRFAVQNGGHDGV